MLAKHLYAIVHSQENTVAFLKERGLIEMDTPPCVHCGSQTKFYTRKERGKERTAMRYKYIVILLIFMCAVDGKCVVDRI